MHEGRDSLAALISNGRFRAVTFSGGSRLVISMTFTRNHLLATLALTSLGGVFLAWIQYQELVELRAAAMSKDERAELQKRVWNLEKRNRELQDQLSAVRVDRPAEGDAAVSAAGGDRPAFRPGASDRGRGGRGPEGGPPQLAALRDLMTKPEVQALMSVQQKAAVESRYASFFRGLNLPADQVERLKGLLVERQTTVQDVLMAARDQGVDPRSDPAGFRKLIADARESVNTGIRSLLGDGGFAQLQNYEQTMPQRGLVNDLQQRLSYTNTPLTPTQAEQLVQILAANPPPPRANSPAGGPAGPPPPGSGGPVVNFMVRGPGDGGGAPGRGFDFGPILAGALGGGGPDGGFIAAFADAGRGGTVVTSGAVAQAQTILAPPQLEALQDIRRQQQSQQQLQQLVREAIESNSPAPPAERGRGTPPGEGPRRRPGG